MKSATALEKRILDIVLRELRGAVRTRQQITVFFDPWVCEPGCYVFVDRHNRIAFRTIKVEHRASKRRGRR